MERGEGGGGENEEREGGNRWEDLNDQKCRKKSVSLANLCSTLVSGFVMYMYMDMQKQGILDSRKYPELGIPLCTHTYLLIRHLRVASLLPPSILQLRH